MTAPCPPRDGSPPFAVRVDSAAGRLELAGRLDHRAAEHVRVALSTLGRTGCDPWVVDVAGLTGPDHVLHTVEVAHRGALRHGRRITLVGTPPWLRRALARLRVDGTGGGPPGSAGGYATVRAPGGNGSPGS